ELTRLSALVAQYQRHASISPFVEQELTRLTQERTAANEEIADLQRKQQLSDMAADVGESQRAQEFRLVNPPMLPSHPTSKKRQTASLGALAIGRLLGIALAFLLDLRKPTYDNDHELKRKFAPAMVLSIPTLPTPRERRARAWKTGFETVVGSVVAVGIGAAE